MFLSEVQFESQGKQAVVVSSSVPAQALPVSGTLSEQLDTLNAGPPPFDASWRRAHTWSDFHQAASFRCDEVVAPLAQPYVAAETFLPGVGEVTLNNCRSAFYRFTFTLPPDFTTPCLFGVANVDEQAVAFLNGHQISGTMTNPGCEPDPANGATDPCYEQQDTGKDLTDAKGRRILTAPTSDPFGTCTGRHFVPGKNELVFAVAGDAGFFAPTGVEFLATVTFDLKDNDPGVGGSITGTMVQQITCRNLTTDKWWM